MKMKSEYRKAKKFRLDEDLEVEDKFTGTAKRPMKCGWDYYDNRAGMWHRFPGINGFLRTAVGRKWDNVFSQLIGRTKKLSWLEADFIRGRIRSSVETNIVMLDEIPHILCRWNGFRPISEGEFYVDSDGVLQCVPCKPHKCWSNAKKKYVVDKHGDKQECKEVGGCEFFLQPIYYQFRISAGVFKTVEEKVWLKSVPYQYTYRAFKWERDALGIRKEVSYTAIEDTTKITTASKKEIRDYNLNKGE